ncbi:MAG: iron ABC transporter permease [Chloroflexi bacterium]|nr:iron ABC transporter permease [Chloroflexota bacterium]
MQRSLAWPRQRIDLDIGRLVLLGPAYLTCALILLLLFVILWMSLHTGLPGEDTPLTLENFQKAFADPFTYRLLLDTLTFAFMTLATVVFFALPMTLLMERTDLPYKRLFEVLIGIKILIPSFLVAIGWVLLLSPRNGLINVWLMGLLGLDKAPFSIYSIAMMGFVQGLGFTPIAYFMVAAAFRSVDPALEEASRMSGAGTLQTILRVTLPTTLPATVAAFIYVGMVTFAVFEIPGIIGAPLRIYVFSTAIYRATNPDTGLPAYGLAGAYGSIVLILGLILSYFYLRIIRASHKYAVVTGKGYRPRLLELGKWKWPAVGFMALYFIPALLLPFLILVWVSLIPYLQVPSMEALASVSLARYFQIGDFLALRPILNTAFLITVAPTIVIALSAIISWLVVKSQVSGRQVLDTVAFLPHTVPQILFAVSLAYLALIFRDYVPIYGTVIIILIAQVVANISFGTRTMNSALIQLHRELEEAARMAGASLANTMWNITVPLVRHAVLNGWIWLALLSFREVTMAITLMTSEANAVLTTQIWRYWNLGRMSEAATLGVVIFFIMAAFVAIARGVGNRIAER